MPKIRNFCIIAHIDHGKSTLADRLLMRTGAMNSRNMQEQSLDTMDLERERGITIKASAVSVEHTYKGETFEINFIDTPGHVDFHYEVSRALAACDGAVLVVDATQGVEAQTVANLYKAVDADLVIIPVINKIDLPSARPEEIALQVEHVLGLNANDCIFTSAKTGQGVLELLDAICERFPDPKGDTGAATQALIFDAKYDDYRGVIVYFRVMNGRLQVGDKILMMSSGRNFIVTEVGKFRPQMTPTKDPLEAGDVGYLVASIKTLGDVKIGDTITQELRPCAAPLSGYKEPQPMVFCDFYPSGDTEFDELREAIGKLRLNDASFVYEPTTSEALGSGFRCGFLGLLHMDIIQERLEREGRVTIVQTAPTVTYEIEALGKGGDYVLTTITNPSEMPDASKVREIREPIVACEIITPTRCIGDIMKLCEQRRGTYKAQRMLGDDRQILDYELPLAEIIYDFFDKLKSITSGYGTMDYHLTGFRNDDLVKMDILVNGDVVEALSVIVHRTKAEFRGRHLLKRLKEQIDRHLFEIPLQAAIGGKIIARETIKSVGKNVTAKCYGGDVSRKRKLLEKQKEGKQRMKRVGSVEIPQEAFLAVLRSGDGS
ncbi:MAG: translation elongation factor 4 [Planctomycetes bacterium]|nr:translation elongation factor 4 [Planctomycetota bacterium]